MVDVPRQGLRIMQIKIGEKIIVAQVPQARSVISHGVINAGNIVLQGQVSMKALMQRVLTKQGGGRGRGGDGTSAVPEECC